jgi:hypothetical protein
MVPVDWPAFEEWETVPMLDGPDTHLCPRCQLKRDRGWLQHDLVIECARCGRNSIDHGTAITQWWTLPDGGTTCDDCHDPETDVTRI